MSQVNTLFKYFTKKNTPSKKTDSNEGHVDSSKSGKSESSENKECSYVLGDLLWARLDGYPWWPSIVCDHPTKKRYLDGKPGKKKIHVQFFDEPVSRAWIPLKSVKPFTGSQHKDYAVRGGQFYSTDPLCLKGAKNADKAMEMTREDRLCLVTELLSTDEDEEPAEPMEFENNDLFDKELDSEEESSKENKEKNISTPSKSPRKTPSKRPKRSVKRRRIVESGEDDDSEDEFKPKNMSASSESESSGVDEEEVSEPSNSDPDSPVKGVKRKRIGSLPKSNAKKSITPFQKGPRIQRHAPSSESDNEPSSPKGKELSPKNNDKKDTPNHSLLDTPNNSKTFTPVSVCDRTKSKLASFAACDPPPTINVDDDGRKFLHLTLKWLMPENIRDADKRKPDDPDYDPRTVYVPPEFLSSQTPGMRQWWDLKAKYFDTILFFKMGKFYELFHMDSTVAVNELGLIYMKGDHAHCGFPEIAYGRYAETLIGKGYKVARIEQTETPDMMAERCKTMGRSVTKFDKVVKREVCGIQTKGTKRYSFLDGDASSSANSFLLAFCEKPDAEGGVGSIYGVCFVDTSIGKFHVGQFSDDRHCSRLRTLLSHYPPAQIIYARGKVGERTNQLLSNTLTSALKEVLVPGKEFWDSTTTLKHLAETNYFADEKYQSSGVKWPEVIKHMMSDADTLGQSASEDYDLAISSLGAVTWYLRKCLIDHELLSMANFEEYTPIDSSHQGHSDEENISFGKQRMVLDGVTLANLDVLKNANTGTLEGTLLERLDMCVTCFGKRLFKQWLCAPLCSPDAIDDRLDAVEDLMANNDVVAEVVELMKKLPDLERLLSKIHTLGSSTRKENHPDGRAIMYEEVAYGKKKIEDFLSALEGFKNAKKIAEKFNDIKETFKSNLLKQTVDLEEGRFPKLSDDLIFFEKAFDHNKARSEGTIKPRQGMDPDYDEALLDIKNKTIELNNYLDQQRTLLGCKQITYWGTGKNRFQLEVPDNVAKKVPHEYDLTSQKKGFKRYKTQKIETLFSQLMEAEERKDEAIKDCMRRIFFNFDKSYQKWDKAVQCLAVLDVLISMAQYSRCGDGAQCRPQVVLPSKSQPPFLELREARHPCICRTFSGGDFIPNDIVIGEKDDEIEDGGESKIVLVTGPNMGGKSTLMRQVGTIVIMAQLGCYVPAEKCRMTTVDRIFTRLGASDRIMAGESTFYVELSETSAILQHATPHSIVLVDELGRGTATYDGTAIACAVVNELSQNINCRTLFSTHYHSLVEHFAHDKNIRTGHMACMVENENDEDPSEETITFLYKFTHGVCPKSYGFNAARLANIPDEIIKNGKKKAIQFEESTENLKVFRKVFNIDDSTSLMNLRQQIKVS